MPKAPLFAVLTLVACAFALQDSGAPASRVADPFATGWMLADTNGDGIADSIVGKVVVPASPSAAENAAAANLAARLGYGTTGLTPPVVITAGGDTAQGPRIFIGKDAVPAAFAAETAALVAQLAREEGGVFDIHGNLAVLAADDEGLLAAAAAYSARAPYQWRVPGDHLSQLGDLSGVTYVHGKAGVNRAFLRSGRIVQLNPPAASPAPAAPANAQADATGNPPPRLDLAALYTSRGLFTGSPRMPVPSTLDSHLFVPAGTAGVAMANLAARMGMETTGITLPLASPADKAAPRDVRNKAVIAGDAALSREAGQKLRTPHAVLEAGEGEVDIVDDAFTRRPAVLARGDDTGAAAAIDWVSGHAPNLWETGKQYLAIDEIRYDLHRFFSVRSGAGQAATALYHLERWAKDIGSDAKDVKAEVYVDVADPKLAGFIGQIVPGATVKAASLRAGTRCCDELHFRAPGVDFQKQTPTFAEDVVIPWEGKRLVDSVRAAASKIARQKEVKLAALVSEGPDQRRKLEAQLKEILSRAGADPQRTSVTVLCAYKPGYSWLMDDVANALASRPVASLRIEFARNVDPTGMRSMWSEARWVQELYPVDEMLARKLNIPLDKVTLNQFEPAPGSPTYRARAFDAGGQEILTREFTVPTVSQPYNGVIPRYEQVQVDTGWVKLEAGGKLLLDERIKTDIEEFWDHYQNQTLPKVWQFVMAQVHGELRSEFAPPFDTLKIDIHMSEPDYNLDLDRERISSLEALQEDTFYSTDNFMAMMGDLETGRPLGYIGRVIPIVHRSEDGQDGRVHIEFYGKPEANPLVRLSWTDRQGHLHKQERNLPAIGGEMMPRLVQARVKAGAEGVERLTWIMAADFLEDNYDDWLKLEGQDQVDRSLFPVERARGQLRWLEKMHAAGLYPDDLAYPHLKQMAIEFELPLSVTAKPDTVPERVLAEWTVTPPVTKRPLITEVAAIGTTPIVQWDEAISPAENAGVLARLAKTPGVTVYWMGRSYLGENIWAADMMLPSPSTLRSVAKEATTKPVIVYSGRQHANEVSSTSHILKLGEELASDPGKREVLKRVNVVLHPIANPDGAQLSVDLAKITPDNMLHPGYHGSLSADVSAGQTETDPIYPESRTRKQLIDAWLPDAFLNPHGYPSHEWVQPFSEYSGWVQSRQGANNGRAWWIPRGWFTSLGYLRDEQHPYSKATAYALQDRIVAAEREVPGLLPLEQRMNGRYERFGQRWQPKNMFQPLVNDIRIYMALKGSAGRGGAGGAGGEGGAAGAAPAPGSGGVGGISPDITWDAGYTEAPDETAHGEYMKLVASAGLAFDWVHLKYLADGDQRVTRTEREAPGGGVQWRIERARPVLPK
ncbi:MAG TPA: M14 family zinc carboxypeptidase [Candidatus Acidoferrales bacterium]|nr:M14 family zinc carboxypeptidase [Candidatus Acidoferrales bacterium]